MYVSTFLRIEKKNLGDQISSTLYLGRVVLVNKRNIYFLMKKRADY